MIQPVSNFNPRPVSKKSNIASGKSSNKVKDNQTAILNACGAGVAIGGLTAAIARSHTSSWANAIVLGLFGTFLSLFFMTPQIVSNKNKITAASSKSQQDAAVIFKKDATKTSAEIKQCLRPVKKMVQFRQTTST